MAENQHPIFELLQDDPRYKLEAYQFVRDALSFAQEVLGLGKGDDQEESSPLESEPLAEPHLTGQQLCEAVLRSQYPHQFQPVSRARVLNGVHELPSRLWPCRM